MTKLCKLTSCIFIAFALLTFTVTVTFAAPSGQSSSVKGATAIGTGVSSSEKLSSEDADIVVGKGECKTLTKKVKKGTEDRGNVTFSMCDSTNSKQSMSLNTRFNSLTEDCTLPAHLVSSSGYVIVTADHRPLFCGRDAKMSYSSAYGGSIVRWFIGSPGGGYFVDIRFFCMLDSCLAGSETGLNDPDQVDAVDLLYDTDFGPQRPKIISATCI